MWYLKLHSIIAILTIFFHYFFTFSYSKNNDTRTIFSGFWGSYEPKLLIGTRCKSPKSLVAGVAWSSEDGSVFRHLSTDKVDSIGWSHHDGETYGHQEIIDTNPLTYIKVTNTFSAEYRDVVSEFSEKTNRINSIHHRVKLSNLRFSDLPSNLKHKELQNIPDRHVSLYTYFGLEDNSDTVNINFLPSIGSNIVWLQDRYLGIQSASPWIFLYGNSTDPLVGQLLIGVRLPNWFTLSHGSNIPYFSFSRIPLPKPRENYAWDVSSLIQKNNSISDNNPFNFVFLNNTTHDKAQAHLLGLQFLLPINHLHPSDTIEIHIFSSVASNIIERQNYYSESYLHHKKQIFFGHHNLNICLIQNSVNNHLACNTLLEQFYNFYFGVSITHSINTFFHTRRVNFEQRFQRIFISSTKSNRQIAGFNFSPSTPGYNMARYALSNLLGGYGYFNGQLKIRLPQSHKVKTNFSTPLHSSKTITILSESLQLFSGTPSRVGFPRPFLWDEGFHLAVVRRWNMFQFFASIESWLRIQFHSKKNNYIAKGISQLETTRSFEQLTSELSFWNGWIPREVVLGRQGQHGVPLHFQIQDIRIANPPSIILPLISHFEAVHDAIHYLNTNPFVPLSSTLKKLLYSYNADSIVNNQHYLMSLSCPSRHPFELSFSQSLKSNHLICSLDTLGFSDIILHTRIFLAEHGKKLKEWFHYFHRTQRSSYIAQSILPSTNHSLALQTIPIYRWAQRTPEHTLASGLDDYPRGMVISSEEGHLDLQSWVACLSNGLDQMNEFENQFIYFPLYDNTEDLDMLKSINLNWPSTMTQQIVAPILLNTLNSNTNDNKHYSVRDWFNLVTRGRHVNYPLFYNPQLQLYSDYLHIQPERADLVGSPLSLPPWRSDGRCGEEFPSPVNLQIPAPCNPFTKQSCCSPSGWCGSGAAYCECYGCKHTPTFDNKQYWLPFMSGMLHNVHSSHIGYVTLMPFLLGLLPRPVFKELHKPGWSLTPLFTNNYVNKTNVDQDYIISRAVQTINNILSSIETELISPAGIRSLSKNDILYHNGEDYWRGDVWININYLFLSSVNRYYIPNKQMMPEMLQKIPNFFALQLKLRRLCVKVQAAVISTMLLQYQNHQTLFEHYSDDNQEGRGFPSFTGWSATVLLMLQHFE